MNEKKVCDDHKILSFNAWKERKTRYTGFLSIKDQISCPVFSGNLIRKDFSGSHSLLIQLYFVPFFLLPRTKMKGTDKSESNNPLLKLYEPQRRCSNADEIFPFKQFSILYGKIFKNVGRRDKIFMCQVGVEKKGEKK